MRYIHRTRKIARNRFSLLNLFERDMNTINSFRPNREFEPNGDEDEIIEHLELVYELEYKYSMLTSKPFEGSPQRQDNIIKIIEKKAKEVIKPIADALIYIFDEWLSMHALTDPKKWAEERMKENDDDGIKVMWSDMLRELSAYSPKTSMSEILSLLFKNKAKSLDPFIKYFLEMKKEDLEMQLSDEGLTEFQSIFSYYSSQEIEDEDEAYDAIYELTKDFRAYAKALGSDKDAFEDIVSELEDIGYVSNSLEMIDSKLISKDMIQDAYQYIVFPVWYKFWKAKGIDKTRATIDKATKELSKISSLPIVKQFSTLNFALNVSHQSGGMIDYFENEFGVGKRDLERLSKMDTREWDDELREIGVMSLKQ